MIAHLSELCKIVYIDILQSRRIIVCGFIAVTLLKTVSAFTEKTGKFSAFGLMIVV